MKINYGFICVMTVGLVMWYFIVMGIAYTIKVLAR